LKFVPSHCSPGSTIALPQRFIPVDEVVVELAAVVLFELLLEDALDVAPPLPVVVAALVDPWDELELLEVPPTPTEVL